MEYIVEQRTLDIINSVNFGVDTKFLKKSDRFKAMISHQDRMF